MGHKLNKKRNRIPHTTRRVERVEENYEPQSRVNEVCAQFSAIIIYFCLAAMVFSHASDWLRM